MSEEKLASSSVSTPAESIDRSGKPAAFTSRLLPNQKSCSVHFRPFAHKGYHGPD